MASDHKTANGRRCFDEELPTHTFTGRDRNDELDEFLDIVDEDVWASKLLNQGETLAAAGRLSEAIELVGLVLTLEPRNDVARARIHGLTARLIAKRQARTDDTLQVGY